MKHIIYIASDHAGFNLKEILIKEIRNWGYTADDCGTDNAEISVDYPDFGDNVVSLLEVLPYRGILICGSGIGMAMMANRTPCIRAAVCHDVETAKLARQHGDINVLALGARMIKDSIAIDVVKTFLTTEFEGGRHIRRLKKFSESECDWL